MPKPFNLLLTESERDQLEAHRQRLGLRSQADVVRRWIVSAPDGASAIPARSEPLTEGKVRKGGRNSATSQIQVRPPPTRP